MGGDSHVRIQVMRWIGVPLAAVLVAGCGGLGAAPSPTADAAKDKLAQILARGTLVLSTDPAYPPQSYTVEGAKRIAGTKCGPSQLTADEVAGYDADTGKLVAKALGVEPCFVEPSWTEVVSGNWGDRWDITWQSGSINADRMQRLWMTQPYYAVDNFFYVRQDSPYRVATDLSGKSIGACAGCSHELYLKGQLEIPGVDIVVEVKDPKIVTYDTEPLGLKDVVGGKLDAFLCAATVGQEAIDQGESLRALDKSAFPFFPSGFIDKSSGLSSRAFFDRVNQIITAALEDGTLTKLSQQYFKQDYASPALNLPVDKLGQVVS